MPGDFRFEQKFRFADFPLVNSFLFVLPPLKLILRHVRFMQIGSNLFIQTESYPNQKA